MKRKIKRSSRAKKMGLSPGSVVYVGLKNESHFNIDLIRYNEAHYEESVLKTISTYKKGSDPDLINWFSFNGLSKVSEVENAGRFFGMSVLDIEDLVNTAQRPALNISEDYLVLIMKLLSFDQDSMLRMEHVSFVLLKNSLLMFHESDQEEFAPVKERMKISTGRIRTRGSDYLLFALMDSIVDSYFQLVESLIEKVEALEDRIFEGKSHTDVTTEIQLLKKEVLRIRRAVNPLAEITSRLMRIDNDLVTDQTKTYMKDLHEHVAQVVESVEMNREMIWGLMDMHMTLLSNRMNEVMKVLTIISTIFIPLSFVAGVYGMNFEHMPELKFQYSYFILLGVMGIIIVSMIIYFKRKKWL